VEAGLQAHDPAMDYVTDVFVGPRKDGAEKNMAVDYVRHGIELSRLSDAEMAARFNVELSRAVRYEAKRSEAAERLIGMHKRHGEGVACVLEKMIQEHARRLVQGSLEDSSLLALFLGTKQLEAQRQEAQARKDAFGAAKELDRITTDSQLIENVFSSVLAKFHDEKRRRPPKRAKLLKREAVIFGAILLGRQGVKYCHFLQERGIRPKWSDFGHESYPKSYLSGGPWRKKIHDEKTRAKSRMNRYTDAELANAFSSHLSDLIDELRRILSTRARSQS
jgi:hypothetical protein